MKRLLIIGAAALVMAAGCGSPTDTLTAQDVHQRMDNATALMLVDCQLDLVRAEKGKAGADVYFAGVIEETSYENPAPVIMWNDGYGPDGCEMFHPDFEGEE